MSHAGTNRCYTFLKNRYVWPAMKCQIFELVEKCNICVTFKPSRPEEPYFLDHDRARQPMDKLHMDLFSIKNAKYLFLVDKFSQYSWF